MSAFVSKIIGHAEKQENIEEKNQLIKNNSKLTQTLKLTDNSTLKKNYNCIPYIQTVK